MTRHVAGSSHEWRPGSRFARADDPGERLRGRHVAAAVALHLAVLAGALFLPGVEPPPDDIITVELVTQDDGAAGAAGGGSPAAETPTPRPPAVARPHPKPKPQLKPQFRPQPRPQPTPIVQTPRRQAEAPPAEAPPAEAPSQVEPLAEPAAVAAPSAPPAEAAGASSGAGARGPAGAAGTGAGSQGPGAGAFGAGDGPGDEYFERLRRWLARHKRYPDAALKQKQQGTVVVEFVVARDGTVLQARIERSSGHPLLDGAVMELLRDASPVPPLPAHFKDERIRIAMPIDYKIGFFGRLF